MTVQFMIAYIISALVVLVGLQTYTTYTMAKAWLKLTAFLEQDRE